VDRLVLVIQHYHILQYQRDADLQGKLALRRRAAGRGLRLRRLDCEDQNGCQTEENLHSP